MKKVVLCGGHLTPALALIEQLQKEKNIELIFYGRKHSTEGAKNLSAEHRAVENLGIQFVPITAGRLQRKFTKYTILAILKIPVGFVQSFLNLISTKPSLVVSFGGYLSTPVVFSAWLLGIKAITHEQSSIMGLANKINSFFCSKVYLSWPQTVKNSSNKYEVIGNLTRESVFAKTAKDPKVHNFLKTNRKLIFVMGGNQGSHFINRLIFESLPKFSKYSVIHQVGATNYKGDLDHAKEIKQENYLALDYLEGENFGAVLNRADLIISRSGANTVWDLAILAKVAILVPLPISAEGEQQANAEILEKAGSSIVINQSDLTAELLLEKIEHLFQNVPKFRKNTEKFSKTLQKNASHILSGEIAELIS